MNRKHLPVVVLCATLFCMNSSQAAAEDLSEIRSLVVAVAAQADSIRCRKPSAVVDNFVTLRKFKEASDLETRLVHRWRDVLSNLDFVADTDMGKAIVLVACGKLTEAEYVEFLGSVLSLVEQDRLDRQYFSFVENPVDEASEGWAVLVRRADEPSVQSIIKRASALFQDRADVVHEFDQMLSGESLRKWDKFKAAARDGRTADSVSDESQDPIVPKSVKRNAVEVESTEDPEGGSTSFVVQAVEDPILTVPPEEAQPEERKRGSVLPLLIGLIAILACVGTWMLRRRA